jgi:hypothetical protein
VYGVRPPDFVGFWARLFGKKRPHHEDVMGERTAVKLEHVRKTYSGKFLGLFGRSKSVVAIEDLSFSVPKVSSSVLHVRTRVEANLLIGRDLLPSWTVCRRWASMTCGAMEARLTSAQERRGEVYDTPHHCTAAERRRWTYPLLARSAYRHCITKGRAVG